MRAIEIPPDDSRGFTPFSIRVDIQTFEELESLRVAAAHMKDGIGIPLHDLLEKIKRESI